MASNFLRLRKPYYVESTINCSSSSDQKLVNLSFGINETRNQTKKRQAKEHHGRISCLDSCCWVTGYLCTTWWLLLFLYHCCLPFTVGHEVPELMPAARLKREGLKGIHPVVLVPGIVTGGLELWEGKPCADGLFRKRLWGGGGFTQLLKRPLCWLEHLSLHNETGLDPPGIRVRPVPGLFGADYSAPGYFVWDVLVKNLAKIGYEGKNLHMAAYDWRLSFQNTEVQMAIFNVSVPCPVLIGIVVDYDTQVRDRALSKLKSKIELMYRTNGNKKVVVVPHSMGVAYFLHFLKWVETPPPMGGGGGSGWCAEHIRAIMNIGPSFLGVPKAVSNILSAEGKDVAYFRAMAPGVLDSGTLGLRALEHVMRVSRTWDSVVSLMPKGGETIWGNMDWSPEDEHVCDFSKKRYFRLSSSDNNVNNSNAKQVFRVKDPVKYGRIISFGKAASVLHSSQLPTAVLKEILHMSASRNFNSSCGEAWTEYDEMSRESIRKTGAADKAYTATTLFDLLRFVAPKMMNRAEAHFSHGIADNLEDPKYNNYKYWSNPLEM
ncbi:hypothetical protein Golax_001642, partial [Gossypium laxum]|nr:hypothetical protein [Gossypium laxum]